MGTGYHRHARPGRIVGPEPLSSGRRQSRHGPWQDPRRQTRKSYSDDGARVNTKIPTRTPRCDLGRRVVSRKAEYRRQERDLQGGAPPRPRSPLHRCLQGGEQGRWAGHSPRGRAGEKIGLPGGRRRHRRPGRPEARSPASLEVAPEGRPALRGQTAALRGATAETRMHSGCAARSRPGAPKHGAGAPRLSGRPSEARRRRYLPRLLHLPDPPAALPVSAAALPGRAAAQGSTSRRQACPFPLY